MSAMLEKGRGEPGGSGGPAVWTLVLGLLVAGCSGRADAPRTVVNLPGPEAEKVLAEAEATLAADRPAEAFGLLDPFPPTSDVGISEEFGALRIRALLELDRARQARQEAVTMAETAKDRDRHASLARFLDLAGDASVLRGYRGRAMASYRRAEEVARKVDDRRRIQAVRLDRARLLLRDGDDDDAEELLDDTDFADEGLRRRADCLRVLLHLRDGERREAGRIAARVRREARAADDDALLATAGKVLDAADPPPGP